jgi:nucleoside phosphorylase
MLQTDILLVTATEVEGRAVLDLFQSELGHPFKRLFIGDKTYFDLGTIADTRVMMVQSEMGAGGPGGALLVVDEGIRELSPSAVILVGIAFGIDRKKHRIGDILVSRQLFGYELQKIAMSNGQEKVIARGDRPQASTRLLDRLRAAVFDWREPKVDFGLILSGDKLIDSPNFRDQLLELAPEAIGGEMEGTGLYSAAQRRKVDWIVIKAIDLITCTNALHYLPDLGIVLTELRRLLAPGGYIVIQDYILPEPPFPWTILERLVQRVGQQHMHQYKLAEAQPLCKVAGFHVVLGKTFVIDRVMTLFPARILGWSWPGWVLQLSLPVSV